jgi:hypothetical protein
MSRCATTRAAILRGSARRVLRRPGPGASRTRILLIAALTLGLFILLVASAGACLTLPALSNWKGRYVDRFGYSGTWSAQLTATEKSPGVWRTEGDGEVFVPYNGTAPGYLVAELTCTGPTTDSVAGQWTDDFGDDVSSVGTLSIGSSVALETGTWLGSTTASPSDTGEWEGEFHPTQQSGGSVPGTVEVESSPGTLITSLQTHVATELPLLPSPEDIAPVGGVSFAANLPVGATIKVKLNLPPGSHPTNLFKLVKGAYVEVPATISGEAVEFEITDGGPFDEDHVANGEVIDPVIPVSGGLQVRTGELPTATRGSAYSVQLTASGGTAPYKWSKAGKLPKGLKLTTDGVIEGTPSDKLVPGSYTVQLKVADSAKPKHKSSASFTLTIK